MKEVDNVKNFMKVFLLIILAMYIFIIIDEYKNIIDFSNWGDVVNKLKNIIFV